MKKKHMKNLPRLFCALLITLNVHGDEPFGILYAPWRSRYIATTAQPNTITQPSCKMCKATQENALNEFPLLQTKNFTVTLNVIPYAKGHTLIIPKTHVKSIYHLTKDERAELIELITDTAHILEQALQAPGINIGYNQGKTAGASIADHMHVHILPRFENELSFIQTLGNTRVIQWEFKDVQSQLLPFFAAIQEKY